MTIRPFSPDDTRAVMDIWHDVVVHDQAFVPQSFWDGMKGVVEEQYLPASRTWVAVGDGGDILGFISLVDDLVGALFVHRQHQSRGIGAALVAHAADVQSPLHVEVYEKNLRARAFYRRHGFVAADRFVQEETGETLIRKRLGKSESS